jgi:5'-methylthioadenosine phosphorylase
MGRLAVVLGSNALGPEGGELAAAAAEHGAAIAQRHGETYVLPHEIDHVGNLTALVEHGCDRVLAIGSVGSLSTEIAVGSFLCPDDFIALHLGISAFADERAHSAPEFDHRWRREVIEAWEPGGPGLRDGGIYWQTVGPRFETPAEVRMIAARADVVGMTIASECIVARELGLSYAAICVVDNLANGAGAVSLSLEQIEEQRHLNAIHLREGLTATLPRLGAVGR